MKTDINRLHSVVLGQLVGRGVGKTTAKIHELAGVIELGDSQVIFCVMTVRSDRFYLRRMIDLIFREHKLKLTKRTSRGFICNSKKVRFVLNIDLNDGIIGNYDYTIIRMGHDD